MLRTLLSKITYGPFKMKILLKLSLQLSVTGLAVLVACCKLVIVKKLLHNLHVLQTYQNPSYATTFA
jgi:hypothetical protein